MTQSAPDGPFTVFSGTPKAVEFYRVFTNNTGGDLNFLRFKVTTLSTTGTLVFSPTGSSDVAPTGPMYFGLTLEQAPPSYQAILGSVSNGGLNSTLRLGP